MTMAECIEQRKTTLSGVVETALQSTIRTEGDPDKDWGLTVEAARVAQVFIVDADLRQQLEAEVRNEIKLTSDRSDLQSREAIRLAELASESRVQERKLISDQETLQRQEAMDVARLARERRMAAENLATERQALEFEQERFHSQADVDQDRVNTETPVRLLRIELESEVLREELKLRELQNQVKALKVERDLVLARAQQAMRLEMLPLEQAPQIVESASRVLHGTNLSIYGEDSQLLGQVAPDLRGADTSRRAGRAASHGGKRDASGRVGDHSAESLRGGRRSDDAPGRPGPGGDAERTGGEHGLAPLAQCDPLPRVQACHVRSRGSDAVRERLPPRVEVRRSRGSPRGTCLRRPGVRAAESSSARWPRPGTREKGLIHDAGVQLACRQPERAQRSVTPGIVPDAGRDDAPRPCHTGHLRQSRYRIGHEVDDELGEGCIELAVREWAACSAAAWRMSTPGWRNRAAATNDSEGSTRRDRRRPEAADEFTRERAGTAADVKDPGAGTHVGEIGQQWCERRRTISP